MMDSAQPPASSCVLSVQSWWAGLLASDFAALAPAAVAPATTPRSVRGHCQRRQDFGGRGKNIAGREGLQFGVSSRQRLAVAG